MSFHGVFPILPTPFTASGQVDEVSLRRLIDFEIKIGVHGVSILGFMGESHKMAESERKLVINTVVDQAAGAIPTWVGVRAFGTAGAIEQALESQELGAGCVFVAPISIQNDQALFDHYGAVARAVEIPVMIHDFPESFGTLLSADLIARIANEIPNVSYIKLEELPVLDKLTKIRSLTKESFGIFGGLGGEYFLEELQRGANGIMTGFAFPEVLIGIYNAYRAGDIKRAAGIFDRYMPLIRYEFQPQIGLAYRKFIYHKRGILASQFIRPPGKKLDAYTEGELTGIIERVGLRLDGPDIQTVEPYFI